LTAKRGSFQLISIISNPGKKDIQGLKLRGGGLIVEVL
jgi:hypothetical protein